MGLVEIDWHTQKDIRRDGSIRPYNQKYSTIHGWVTKLRGTLSDNERVRRAGIREMKAAKAVRKWKKERADKRKKRKGSSSSGGGGFLSFFGLRSKSQDSSRAVVVRRESSRRSNQKSSSADVTLYVSHGSKPRRGQSTSSKVSTQSRATRSSASRPAPQRRQTDAPRRQASTRDTRPTRHNTRRSTRP